MQIQIIRNATLRMTCGDHIFLTDPYFAPKHSQEPLIGKSRNPTTDLHFSVENILADIEMAIVSHLHPDHFDSFAQKHLPKNIQIYCQPGDEPQIQQARFSNVATVDRSINWNGLTIIRRPGQHGKEVWAAQMGNVSGFIFRAEKEPTVYWTGDTIWYDAIRQVILETEPDIIITHCGGASFAVGNPIIMDAQQTIEVCRAEAEAEGIEASQLRIPADGETLVF